MTTEIEIDEAEVVRHRRDVLAYLQAEERHGVKGPAFDMKFWVQPIATAGFSDDVDMSKACGTAACLAGTSEFIHDPVRYERSARRWWETRIRVRASALDFDPAGALQRLGFPEDSDDQLHIFEWVGASVETIAAVLEIVIDRCGGNVVGVDELFEIGQEVNSDEVP